MWYSRLGACLLVGLLVTVGVAATAHVGGGHFAGSPLGRLVSGNFGRFLALRADLNLTDQQRAEIKELLVSHKSDIAKAAKAINDKRCALRDAVLAEKADEAAIRAAADELGKAIGDAAVGASWLKQKIAAILTDEQKDLIKDTIEDNDEAVAKFFAKAIKAE